MDCKKADKFLVEYLYQELSASKTVEIEAHLQVCDRCTKILESWRSIHQGFQSNANTPPSPPFLRQRLMNLAKSEMGRKPSLGDRIFALMRPAIFIPAALLAGFALILFWPASTLKMAEFQKTGAPVAAPSSQPIPPTSNTTAYGRRDSYLEPKGKAKADEVAPQNKRETGELTSEERDNLRALGYVDDGDKNAPIVSGSGGSLDQKHAEAGKDQEAGEKLRLQNEIQPSKPAASPETPMAQRAEKVKEEAKPAQEAQNADMAAARAKEPAPAEAVPPAASSPALSSSITETKKQLAGGDPQQEFSNAQSLFKQNQLKTGLTTAQNAIDQDHAKVLAAQFYQSGVSYQSNKEYDKAIIQYHLVQNNYPTYQQLNQVLSRLAECYEAIGKFEDARAIYLQLAKIYPANRVFKERLKALDQKLMNREQLKSLGYVSDDQN